MAAVELALNSTLLTLVAVVLASAVRMSSCGQLRSECTRSDGRDLAVCCRIRHRTHRSGRSSRSVERTRGRPMGWEERDRRGDGGRSDIFGCSFMRTDRRASMLSGTLRYAGFTFLRPTHEFLAGLAMFVSMPLSVDNRLSASAEATAGHLTDHHVCALMMILFVR
jgi:hypothetical protein